MKFKLIIFFLFFVSCVSTKSNLKQTYSSKGFAYIFNEQDNLNKIIKIKLDNNTKVIAHHKLKPGTFVNIFNPENKKNITLKISKKIDYPDFYVILITEEVANFLDLNHKIPYVEIQEMVKKKTFVAKKAKMFNEEKNVDKKAPVQKVQIQNLSINLNKKSKKVKNFFIIIGEFYSIDSAKNLKTKILNESINFDNKKIRINAKKKNNYELFAGPYSSINLLKNDYIELKKVGFEELDIKINE